MGREESTEKSMISSEEDEEEEEAAYDSDLRYANTFSREGRRVPESVGQ